MPNCCLFNVVLLIVSLSYVECLVCHEGFNVSMSGIPLYFWAEHDCAPGSECFMQELAFDTPGEKMKDIVYRYGGCISKRLSPYMACEQLYGENSEMTVDIAFDILCGLDDKMLKFISDIFVDSQTHLFRFFSRGNGPEEFSSGVFEFLESSGFNRAKMKAPIQRLANSVIGWDIHSALIEWEVLLQLAKVDNDVTERLSHALLDYNVRLLEGGASEVSRILYLYVPGLVYPILCSLYPTEKINAFYITISEGLENLDNKNFKSTMSEDQLEAFLNVLLLVQLGEGDQDFESSKMVHRKYKEAIQYFKKEYPASRLPEFYSIQSDIMHNYATEKNYYEDACQSRDCDVDNPQRIYRIKLCRQLEMYAAHYYNRMTSGESDVSKTKGVDPLAKFNSEYVKELRNPLRQWWASNNLELFDYHFAELFDILEPVVKKFAQKIPDAGKKFRKEVSPDACKHLSCTKSLCNSHKAFLSTIDFDGAVRKEL